jgi:hypothetical protein
MLDKVEPAPPLHLVGHAAWNVLRSRWRALLAVAVAGGLLGWLAASLMPLSYTSVAFLSTGDPNVEAIWRSPDVIDRVLKLHPGSGDIEEQRDKLLEHIRWSKVRITNAPASVYRIEVKHRSPDIAQNISSALLASWRQSTKPGPETTKYIEEDVVRLRQELTDVQSSIAKIEKGLESNLSSDTLGKLYEINFSLQEQIVSKLRSFAGVTADVIITPPTVPMAAQRFSMQPLYANALAAGLAALAASLAWWAWLVFGRLSKSRRLAG